MDVVRLPIVERSFRVRHAVRRKRGRSEDVTVFGERGGAFRTQREGRDNVMCVRGEGSCKGALRDVAPWH